MIVCWFSPNFVVWCIQATQIMSLSRFVKLLASEWGRSRKKKEDEPQLMFCQRYTDTHTFTLFSVAKIQFLISDSCRSQNTKFIIPYKNQTNKHINSYKYLAIFMQRTNVALNFERFNFSFSFHFSLCFFCTGFFSKSSKWNEKKNPKLNNNETTIFFFRMKESNWIDLEWIWDMLGACEKKGPSQPSDITNFPPKCLSAFV